MKQSAWIVAAAATSTLAVVAVTGAALLVSHVITPPWEHSQGQGVPASQQGATGTPSVHASANPFLHASEVVHGNITIPATSVPPGPFNIKPLFCGRFTTAQRNQYGTTAAGGLVYRYTNVSNSSFTGWPTVTVNFTSGKDVLGSNVTGNNPPSIQPGQSAIGEVDAVGSGGDNLGFTGCIVLEYAALNASGTEVGGTYPG